MGTRLGQKRLRRPKIEGVVTNTHFVVWSSLTTPTIGQSEKNPIQQWGSAESHDTIAIEDDAQGRLIVHNPTIRCL